MTTQWRTVPVEELATTHPNALATGPFGSAIGAAQFRPSGVPVIRGSNLSEDIAIRLDERDLVFIDEEPPFVFGIALVSQRLEASVCETAPASFVCVALDSVRRHFALELGENHQDADHKI